MNRPCRPRRLGLRPALLALIVLVALSGLAGPAPLSAEVLYSPDWDVYLDLPADWKFLEDPSADRLVFSDPTEEAVVQFLVREGGPLQAETVGRDLLRRLSAQGEAMAFDWRGQTSFLADQRFTVNNERLRGWIFVTPLAERYLAVLAFAPEARFEEFSDGLNSLLNSVAVTEPNRRFPGPLTGFFLATAPAEERPQTLRVRQAPGPMELVFSPSRQEHLDLVMDREFRLLTTYLGKPSLNKAWQRAYRQIFRELHEPLGPLADQWEALVRQGQVAPQALPQAVLSWVQTMNFVRRGGTSDIGNVFSALADHEGDCDTRSLIWAALMDHLGYRALLMVSGHYSHGIAAIDLPGPGTRFAFEGTNWLVAETTSRWNLGRMDPDRGDFQHWLGIDLWGQP